MSTPKEHVESLIRKADEAISGADAMHYAQAAQNAANALCALKAAESTPDAE